MLAMPNEPDKRGKRGQIGEVTERAYRRIRYIIAAIVISYRSHSRVLVNSFLSIVYPVHRFVK